MLRQILLLRLRAFLVLGILPLMAGCIHMFWETQVRALSATALSPGDSGHTIRASIKAHLRDGSTVIFTKGAQVYRDSLVGEGQAYALMSDASRPRRLLALADVLAVEAFEEKNNSGLTIVASLAATAAGAFAFAALAVAAFGSCPTLYAATDQGLELQAEGFSYSIAPLLERRDVDPLRARAGPDGLVRLELRNEALETHYINHVELLVVPHGAGTRVVPDQGGRPIAVAAASRLIAARDRAGRDLHSILARADGVLFETAPATVESARVGDLDDWIDLEAAGLPPGDSVVVLLRLRNSMLNTVLLYEGMLGGRDAIDWLDTGLEHIASTVDFGRWYARTMGLRASVAGVPIVGDPALGHARLGDVGPIAFREVALVLPRSRADADAAHIRLRFVVDNWRIDEVVVAGAFSRPDYERLPVESVVVPTPAAGGEPVEDAAAVRALAEPDASYFETRPGQRMTLVFRASQERAEEVTHLIAWQGWYREWIRGAWLAAPTRMEPFEPGDQAVLTALRSWKAKKADFESQFYSSKIPVR